MGSRPLRVYNNPPMVKTRKRYPVREKIAKNTKREQFKRSFITKYGGKCSVCGYNKCVNSLSFHHVKPELKEFGLDDLRGKVMKYGEQKVIEEAAKCLLVCNNCHSEIHYEESKNNLKLLLVEEQKIK